MSITCWGCTVISRVRGKVGFLFLAVFIVGLVIGGWRHWLAVREMIINPNVELAPNKEYSIVVWDKTLPIAWDGHGYEWHLRKAIERFCEAQPNIRVKLRLLPWEGGLDELLRFLDQGVPPDLYATGQGPIVFEHPLQVRAGLFLGDGDHHYTSLALSDVRVDQEIYCWPRWSDPKVLIGNRKMLMAAGIDVELIQREGWSWQEFSKAAQKIRQAMGQQFNPILFQPGDETAFVSLISTLDSRVEAETYLNVSSWDCEKVGKTLGFLADLWSEGLLPHLPWDRRNTFLHSLVTGRSAIIGPVGVWALRLEQHGQDLCVLPIPHAEHRVYLSQTQGWAIFRQAGKIDNERIKAASLLAEYLSDKFDSVVAQKLGLLPATVGSEAEDIRLCSDAEVRNIGLRKKLSIWRDQEQFICEKLRPAMLEFWKNPARKKQVIADICQGLMLLPEESPEGTQEIDK